MFLWALKPALYSAAVSTSQVISTRIPLTVLGTSAIRSAAVGLACAAFLATSPAAPSVMETPPWVVFLSVLSGVIMFFAAVAYISMCRDIGVVATSVTTTAFSFVFTAIAGAAMGETVGLKTLLGMAAVTGGLALHRMN